MTISYGLDFSAEIGSDYSAKVSADVSSSYSTILQFPKVYDKGNMANDEINIEFEYVDPWIEEYLIYIIKCDRNHKKFF